MLDCEAARPACDIFPPCLSSLQPRIRNIWTSITRVNLIVLKSNLRQFISGFGVPPADAHKQLDVTIPTQTLYRSIIAILPGAMCAFLF